MQVKQLLTKINIEKSKFKQYKVLSKHINAMAKRYALNNVSNKYGKVLVIKNNVEKKIWDNIIDGLFSWQAWLMAIIINFAVFGFVCFLALTNAIPVVSEFMDQFVLFFGEPTMSPEEIYKEAERIVDIAKESKKENENPALTQSLTSSHDR
ncbi:hypothetical protein ACTFIV_006914 [Dictyostelium citrinum]